MDTRPIALFDSGLGGLTVMQKIKELLPNEDIIYFGDTARVPYGSKSKETIINYSREIVSFLTKQNVKLIIIACGTASSLAYDTLKKEFSVPIINVIIPTCKTIKSQRVGVIATNATIKSKAWELALNKYHKDIEVYSKACPLFVPIVEESLANSEIAKNSVDLYLKHFKNKKIDSLILGCTHYPIMGALISNYLGKGVKILNIGEACSKEVKMFLTKNDSLNSQKKAPYYHAYLTDSTASFKKNAKLYCDIEFDKVTKISLS